jgi:uncharacterized protein
MEIPTTIDLQSVAKNLDLPANKVSAVVELLEAGNTIPFITRYRKDETGGLGERQVRDIRQEVSRQTALAERKSFVLKTIDSQGQLTDSLREQIEKAEQARQVENLYFPFKPRKSTLAETARQQGLEPLARDILEGHQPEIDLASRAIDFVRVDKGLSSVDDVIRGVKHILAERFSEDLTLREELRKRLWQSGKICTETATRSTGDAAGDSGKTGDSSKSGRPAEASETPTSASTTTAGDRHTPPSGQPLDTEAAPAGTASDNDASDDTIAESSANSAASSNSDTNAATEPATEPNAADTVAGAPERDATPVANSQSVSLPKQEGPPASGNEAASDPAAASSGHDDGRTAGTISAESHDPPAATDATDATDADQPASQPPAAATAAVTDGQQKTTSGKSRKKRKKKKKKKSRPDPFAEFAKFEESLQKIPPHRTLAINRGERAGKLKVRIRGDAGDLNRLAASRLVPQDHPFDAFLNAACDDAMARLILPAIEREIRRDLTERAESHAVSVFARNLRHLLLQPPVNRVRIMGIDPGYRSGCKVAVIDETGQPLGHGVFSIVGNTERIRNNHQRLVDLITKYEPQLIAIGSGSGCRATEQFVSDVISGELADRQLQYAIVNQAGTSVYSTSELGQTELPDHDPVIRSAISIARRLQDPLSELVKVNPAHIGVGLYQHDIKARHLAESLESVVESCVNHVGVNVNTASPSLLKYVSGLGQSTSRNLVEYRNQHGRFANRQQLKNVSGFGDVTFVQSAGFLRIENGDNSLDRTSIHPEDYELVNRILNRLGCTLDDLVLPPRSAGPPRMSANPPATSAAPSAPSATTPADRTVVEQVAVEKVTSDEPAATPDAPPAAGPSGPAATASDQAAQQPAMSTAISTAISPAMAAERRKRRKELIQKIKALHVAELASELGVGEMKLRDLLRSLRNPLQDPREELPAPVFRTGILNFDDLKAGMQLRGQIVNVVDFGVFLNIGIGESCLVHISRLANRFVRDPHWLYAVGDVLNVWVQEVDPGKRRVTLTAIRPDADKRDRRRSKGKPAAEGGRHSRRDAASQRSDSGKSRKRPAAGRGRKTHSVRRAKPKPVKPITEEMVQGKEPMRSFSDLLQFHQRKSGSDEKPDKKS